MTYTPKLGSGSVFRNIRKSNEKQPDWRGDFIGLDGVRYELVLWERQGQKGPYLSLSVKNYTPRVSDASFEAALKAAKEATPPVPVMDDDIPF